MDLPAGLKEAMEKALEGEKPQDLKKVSSEITRRYKNESGQNRHLIDRELEAKVYAAVRMPATFSAVSDAMEYSFSDLSDSIETVLDIGDGSGAATWAAEVNFAPKKIMCLEREEVMRKTGALLMQTDPDLAEKTTWQEFDLLKDSLSDVQSEKSDLIISSYVLNELSPKDRASVVDALWNAAGKYLLIVEPGTKEGFSVIAQIRNQLLSKGAHLLAPCPHDGPCAMSSDDWCHFACRVQRSRLHKMLKDADVPYEDEKYSYVAFAKEAPEKPDADEAPCARVLRHPYVSKGQIDLVLCTKDGIEKKTVRKRDGEAFKRARKCKQGDAF
ncbi:MAG: hypothetical protein J6Y08_04165 [Clostridiales bacterium]|nr:hypothetical protein [Clostridiales bacterium]